MRFEIHVGDKYAFDGITTDLDVAQDEHPREKLKTKSKSKQRGESFSVKLTAVVSAIFVTSAGGYGLLHNDWTPLATLWVFLGPVVGALIGKNVMPNA
jgi:hypothetical protein